MSFLSTYAFRRALNCSNPITFENSNELLKTLTDNADHRKLADFTRRLGEYSSGGKQHTYFTPFAPVKFITRSPAPFTSAAAQSPTPPSAPASWSSTTYGIPNGCATAGDEPASDGSNTEASKRI